jgi:hypothetical protein
MKKKMNFAMSMVMLSAALSSANAFTAPPSFSQRIWTTLLYVDKSKDNAPPQHITNDFDTIVRPLSSALTSTLLASSLLFSSPLLPPPEVQAASPVASPIATSVEIEIKNIPALTRKAVANREQLTNYLIESAKSIKPILELLSDSDTVTVTPPKDIKKAVNALLAGDAQFNVNGESVDVRVESVPGVIVVRVINPNIPRIPFLKDGTAALKFVDEIIDVAPAELEKIAEEAEAIEKFLTWGSTTRAPITYKGSSLDYFLSRKFLYNGNTVSLGSIGDLTNSEVIIAGLGVGIAGAYGSSYVYYVSEKEKEEKEASEKKAAVAANKKAKAGPAAAKVQGENKEKPTPTPINDDEQNNAMVEDIPKEKKGVATFQVVVEKKEEVEKREPVTTTKEDSPLRGDDKPKRRKRDAIKNIFRRKKE